MVILFNPKNGSKIEHFRHQRMGELNSHDVGELKQYENDVAEELIKIFGFLEIKTPAQAQEILAKPKEAALKCKYCDFSTDHKVALAGHNRSHQEEIAKAKEPSIDPSLVPVADASPVEPLKSPSAIIQDDLHGPEWYGSGLTEDKK